MCVARIAGRYSLCLSSSEPLAGNTVTGAAGCTQRVWPSIAGWSTTPPSTCPVTPLWRTADWGYLRLHEGTADPWPSYGQQALRSWVDRAAQAWPGDADVYVYFNNDPGGAAVVNSAVFAALARDGGLAVTRTPPVGGVPLTTAIATW
jgi:hypothetical protein